MLQYYNNVSCRCVILTPSSCLLYTQCHFLLSIHTESLESFRVTSSQSAPPIMAHFVILYDVRSAIK